MRSLIIFGAAALFGGAAAIAQDNPPAQRADRFDMPSYQQPVEKWRDIADGLPADPEKCAEKIRQVRAEAGKPVIERAPADPQEPLMIAAVDERIEECRVLVMKDDTSDIRPIPQADTTRIVLQPVD